MNFIEIYIVARPKKIINDVFIISRSSFWNLLNIFANNYIAEGPILKTYG